MSRTRLYVGNISRRSRTSDIEYLFSKYGRVVDIDLKHDYGFVEFEDSRDAEDAVYELDGYRLDGVRLVVERARHPRGGAAPDRFREERRDRPAPGSGKCYNCGKEGHWARDCSAGDWSNRCYRCGKDGHLERNCPADGGGDKRSSRSPSPRRAISRSASPRRRSSRSRSRSRSASPPSRGAASPHRAASPTRRTHSPSGPRGNADSEMMTENMQPQGDHDLKQLDTNKTNGFDAESVKSPAKVAAEGAE